MAFEDRLKAARKNANMTQQQAAISIGVAKSTWAGYELGSSQPDISKLVKIMEALNVDANYLWQDYFPNKKGAPTLQKELSSDNISLEDSNSLLAALGFISEGQQLSDDDLAFLTVIISLLDKWFARKNR